MHYGKWNDLFITYQKMHDFGNQKFNQDKEVDKKDTKVHSLMEL